MSDDFIEPPAPEFGTQLIQPVVFRYPTAWMSWQAVIGDLAAQGNPDARLRIEATGAEKATQWTAEIEWGEKSERVTGQNSLHAALVGLWRDLTAHHMLDESKAAEHDPSAYSPHDYLDTETQAALQRLLTVVRAAFGTDWAVTLVYHPVMKADQRIHARLIAKRGEVAISSGGATIIEGARALLRAATPYFPKRRH